MQFINALSILSALIALAMMSVGLFITTFSAIFQRRWLILLLSLTLLLSPIAALKLQLKYPFFLLTAGSVVFIVSLLVSEWVNPRFYWFV